MRWTRSGGDPSGDSDPRSSDPLADLETAGSGQTSVLVQDEPAAAAVLIVASVNLLPHTYAERAAVRRAKGFAVGALIAAALVALLVWLVAWQQQTSAQEDLDAATAERTVLQAEAARYSEVPKVFATVAAAEDQLELAMSNEVRWSFFLNDLALTMPSGVSLDSLAVTSPAPGAATTAAAPSAASASATASGSSGAGVPGIGTMTVAAKALTYNSVANWLDSLAKLPTLADPYVDSITAGAEEGTKIVTFGSPATITTEALSKRYVEQEVAP